MSAKYILYIINFFILIYITLVILNFSLYTTDIVTYKINKVVFGADIADMQTFYFYDCNCRQSVLYLYYNGWC